MCHTKLAVIFKKRGFQGYALKSIFRHVNTRPDFHRKAAPLEKLLLLFMFSSFWVGEGFFSVKIQVARFSQSVLASPFPQNC